MDPADTVTMFCVNTIQKRFLFGGRNIVTFFVYLNNSPIKRIQIDFDKLLQGGLKLR